MMLRSTWRYYDDDPPARRFPTAVALVAAALFVAVWVSASVMLLGALAQRFF